MDGTDIEITGELVAEHGLSKEEYDLLLEIMGRPPTLTELGIFRTKHPITEAHQLQPSTQTLAANCGKRDNRARQHGPE